MEEERDMDKLMGDAVAKFLPQRHRGNAPMPEPGTADKLTVLTLLAQVEADNKRITETIRKIHDQLNLAFGHIETQGQSQIEVIRILRGERQ
jgi:hypothetical protein